MATQMASMPSPVLPVQGAQFAGQTMSRWPFEGTVLTHLVHPLEKHVAAHEHPLPYFSLVLQGHYEEEGRRGFNQYGGFTLAFHPQCTRHTGIVPKGGAEFFTAEVGESWLDDFRGPRALNEAVYELSAGELTWLAVRLFREYREGKYASGLTMESLVWEMLGAAARLQHVHRHTEPEWWPRVIEMLHASVCENVRMTELASEVGVHPAYLSRMFRRIEGKTAGTYVQQLRVQYACRGLRDREKSLAEIAAESGFADQSHMTRTFQRVAGTTPAGMRKALGKTKN
jgi:AraC family transcriptional regulator